MLKRLRAWWNAPLFTMPHLPEPRAPRMLWTADPDCPPGMVYGLNLRAMWPPVPPIIDQTLWDFEYELPDEDAAAYGRLLTYGSLVVGGRRHNKFTITDIV